MFLDRRVRFKLYGSSTTTAVELFLYNTRLLFTMPDSPSTLRQLADRLRTSACGMCRLRGRRWHREEHKVKSVKCKVGVTVRQGRDSRWSLPW